MGNKNLAAIRKNILWENILKNGSIVICLVIFYFFAHSFLLKVPSNGYDAIISSSSLLIVAFLFGDYTFTYSGSNIFNLVPRLLGHAITSTIMFGTGALLEIDIIALNLKLNMSFRLFELLGFIFYLSLILYDFWDLEVGLKSSENFECESKL